ncbi:hypothetical protein [Paenibacillus wulumuqiensis]|uniref:hypothetical protein n=1 Tax=Paenibacillus wulumuqiensis TaxID=1567107 RepID=UPI000619EDB4|nr:hypothetical protein [Paenibacillus wulumuqiensis]
MKIPIAGWCLLLMLTGCTPNHSPDLTAQQAGRLTIQTEDNQRIPVEPISPHQNKDSILGTILKQKNAAVPYVQLGEQIHIQFGGTTPSEAVITDSILQKNGQDTYSKSSQDMMKLAVNQGSISFKIPSNSDACLSSDFQSYQPGRILRGFRLSYDMHGQKQEYLFVIRTDAALQAAAPALPSIPVK